MEMLKDFKESLQLLDDHRYHRWRWRIVF